MSDAQEPQPKPWPRKTAEPPRGWQKIAREAALAIETDWRTATVKTTTRAILAAIERSHAALIVCRDHWKTSFEHERENVIRLREIVYKFHSDDCVCEDCKLVRSHAPAQPQCSGIAIQWRMTQPKVGDTVSRFLTPCCDYEFLASDCPVTWNEFNKVVQCHNCGHVYERKEYPAAQPQGIAHPDFGHNLAPITTISDQPTSLVKATDDKSEEWTVERVKDYLKWGDGIEILAKDFTAELAAERKRREQEQQGRNDYIQRLRDALGLKVGDSLTLKAGEIYQQLLSALAAIEKHNKMHLPKLRIYDVDLSALHQHDAEVRKPLVDLLEGVLVLYPHLTEIADALAKAKP